MKKLNFDHTQNTIAETLGINDKKWEDLADKMHQFFLTQNSEAAFTETFEKFRQTNTYKEFGFDEEDPNIIFLLGYTLCATIAGMRAIAMSREAELLHRKIHEHFHTQEEPVTKKGKRRLIN